jgi:hypothetical protein
VETQAPFELRRSSYDYRSRFYTRTPSPVFASDDEQEAHRHAQSNSDNSCDDEYDFSDKFVECYDSGPEIDSEDDVLEGEYEG